ncbi:Malate dehydrogenase, partial [Gryllus bimaculatus]
MASCPKYAQAEFIAGVLSTKLPHFKVRRMVIDKDDWKNWLWGECKKNDWSHTKSPLVWRELAMPGGKPVLIGGLSEFLEYCHEYYGLTAFLTPEEKQMLVDDNIKINEREMEEKARSQYKVRKILISGATLRILPVLLSELLNLKCVGKEAGT